ncbi:Uncharacterised protein [Mycobacteroides abscessus subsp. abscessus]|nr:Uncharacterised protein [Mycobacteroides abscessus subsp. abscessus]
MPFSSKAMRMRRRNSRSTAHCAFARTATVNRRLIASAVMPSTPSISGAPMTSSRNASSATASRAASSAILQAKSTSALQERGSCRNATA